MITIDDIRKSHEVLLPVINRTPVLSSRSFNAITGNEVFFKAENFQRVGAFKFRGAYNKIHSLSDHDWKRGVIAHSSGNHGQGVALAGKIFGIKSTIVMPHNSVKSKVDATRGYGSEVVFCGLSTDDREKTTQELIDRFGYALIHPYDDDKLIAGQGTVGLEIFQDGTKYDYLFAPVGGGGLISGCAVAAKHFCPGIKVIGVETSGANDCYLSFRQKKLVKIDSTDTIADGMRTLSVGGRNFEIIMRYVDDVITIKDEEIYPMMKFFVERMKIIVEPTGAVAASAVLKNQLSLKGKKIAVIISGGNVDPEVLKKMIS